jgi:PAS domain S-box-containing protein
MDLPADWLRKFRPTSKFVLLVALYCLCGYLGKAIAGKSADVPLVWPPFGLALAAVLLCGEQYWPGVALGALFFGILVPTGSSFALTAHVAGNTAGTLICVYLLKHSFQFRNSLDGVRDVAGFVLLACALGTSINGAFNAAALLHKHSYTTEQLFDLVLPWWIATAAPTLILTPLILVWATKAPNLWRERSHAEGGLCFTGLIFATLLSFRSWYVQGIGDYAMAYLPVPFLVWGSLRFGQRGAVTGTFVVAVMALMETLERRGPFVVPSMDETLVLLGTYISVLAILNMFLAASALEKAKAVRQLAISEGLYRGVLDDQTEMVWRFTEDGTLTFVNEAYCKFHGKKEEELIGTKYLPMLSPEDREIPLAYFQTLPEDAPMVTYDFRLTLPTGQVTTQQCTTRRIFAPGGETLEFQSVARDITQRKQMEDDIREAELRQRFILNSMPDAVLVLDQAGIILSANAVAETILGLTGTQLTGRNIRDFLKEAADLQALEANKRTSKILEIQLVTSQKTELPVELGVSRAVSGGKHLWVAVLRDLRERKMLEEQIRHGQKMEMLGRFSSGIAHDFNNILGVVSGYASLLSRRAKPQDASYPLLQDLERATLKALGMTRQLLTFSRRRSLQLQVVSVNTVLQNFGGMLHPLLGPKIKVEWKLEASPDLVKADPTQLEQVIMNLAVNARDAMPHGGTLQIKTSERTTTQVLTQRDAVLHPGKYLVVTVTDTGCGMTPEIQHKIFEPFFTTKEEGKGTGLGLSIVDGIITQFGGAIFVESRPTKGAAFQIYLPQE